MNWQVTVPKWAIEKIRNDSDHCDLGPHGQGWPSDEMRKALTAIDAALAAAEVGEKGLASLPPEEQRKAHEWMDRKLIAATIERCAHWLEDQYPCYRTVASEMRKALKDKQ